MNIDYMKLMAANESLRSGDPHLNAIQYIVDYLENLAQTIPVEARKLEANKAIFAIPFLRENHKSVVAKNMICPFIDSIIEKSGKIDQSTLMIQVKEEE